MLFAAQIPQESGYLVGWGSLALINAGLAQGKNRSGLVSAVPLTGPGCHFYPRRFLQQIARGPVKSKKISPAGWRKDLAGL